MKKDCKHAKVCEQCIREQIAKHKEAIAALEKQLPTPQTITYTYPIYIQQPCVYPQCPWPNVTSRPSLWCLNTAGAAGTTTIYSNGTGNAQLQ